MLDHSALALSTAKGKRSETMSEELPNFELESDLTPTGPSSLCGVHRLTLAVHVDEDCGRPFMDGSKAKSSIWILFCLGQMTLAAQFSWDHGYCVVVGLNPTWYTQEGKRKFLSQLRLKFLVPRLCWFWSSHIVGPTLWGKQILMWISLSVCRLCHDRVMSLPWGPPFNWRTVAWSNRFTQVMFDWLGRISVGSNHLWVLPERDDNTCTHTHWGNG